MSKLGFGKGKIVQLELHNRVRGNNQIMQDTCASREPPISVDSIFIVAYVVPLFIVDSDNQ